MATKVSFILKTTDAKASQIRNALSDAGIHVRALVEVYREEELASTSEPEGDAVEGARPGADPSQ